VRGFQALAVSLFALMVSAGCQILGGFEDFSEHCPARASACRDGGTGSAGGQAAAPEGGAGGSRASGGATAPGGSGGAPSSGGRGGADGSVEPGRCPHGTDPGSHGPPMAEVMRPSGSCFWIDTTEVTVAEYAEFVRAPHPVPEDGVCAWNSVKSADGGALALGSAGYAPPAECARRVLGGLSLTDGGAGPNAALGQPVTCVDWCDAIAFCVWAGKDLCSDDGDSPDAPDKSDWDDACTQGQAGNLYGCGPGCRPTACNGASSQLGHLAPAGTTPGCFVTANDGKTRIQDLSGNVSEWTGWCSPETAEGQCLTRGGGYVSSDSTLECNSTVRLPRQSVSPTVGFRCCAAAR
jgi:sulfatase modifying factor 1